MTSDVCKKTHSTSKSFLRPIKASPVEEELVVHEGVVRAERHDLLVGAGTGEEAESGGRELLQHPPEDLMPHPAHVKCDSLVQLPRLGDYEGVGGGLLGYSRWT